MIKEIDLPEKARKNSWRYWRDYDSKYHRYEDWIKDEYNITILYSTKSLNSFYEIITGEEKDLTMFLLRWW